MAEEATQTQEQKKLVVTSNEANKLLKTYNEELARLRTVESLSKDFVVSTEEDIESVRPVYDFKATQNAIVNICSTIVAIKHRINEFNVNTVLPCGLTIDQALVYLPILSREQDKLAKMKNRLPKQRVSSWQSNKGVEYNVANYDINTVLQSYYQVSNELEKIQKELDVVNNTVTFEI